jgi:hypothetical protein
MALLYCTKVSGKPNDVYLPSSLQEWWATKLIANMEKKIHVLNPDGSAATLFENETELNSFINAIKLTPEQQAQFDEWKSAHNITVTHHVYEIPTSDITVLNPF